MEGFLMAGLTSGDVRFDREYMFFAACRAFLCLLARKCQDRVVSFVAQTTNNRQKHNFWFPSKD